MNKLSLAFFCLFISCNVTNNSLELKEAFLNSEQYLESADLELSKWLELDSIFVSEVKKFENNISDVEVEMKVYYQSLIDSYPDLSSKFYKDYLINKLTKLEVYVDDVGFDNATEKASEIFSELNQDFYEFNSKMSKEDRVEVAQKIGKFSAKYIKESVAIETEEIMENFEDFAKQLESTFKNLFKE